jgi:hypothetical protein
MSDDIETLWQYDPETGSTKPVTLKKPPAPLSPQEQEQQRTAAVLAEIKRIHGDVSAQDRLRFFASIAAKLGLDVKPAKIDPLLWNLDQAVLDPKHVTHGKSGPPSGGTELSQLEKFQIASRMPAPAPDALVPANLLEPRTPANTPERRLALANAKTDPKSNIQKTLRKWMQVDSSYAQNVHTNAALAAQALETRNQLEADILRMGWKIPKSRAS